MKIKSFGKILLILFFLLITLYLFHNGTNLSKINYNIIKKSVILDYNKNYYQTGYNCGPYSISAILFIKKGVEKKGDVISNEIKNQEIKGLGFLPQSISYSLNKNNIKSKVVNFNDLENSEKVLKIKEILSGNNPIILLVKKHNYQHYITILGYDKNSFHIYDSLDKNDNNGLVTGNETIIGEDLINIWSKGGKYGFYKFTAIKIIN